MRKFALVLVVSMTVAGPVAARAVIARQNIPPPSLNAMAVSPDGKVIATYYSRLSSDCGIDLINAKHGRAIGVTLQITGHGIAPNQIIPPKVLVFSPNGDRLAGVGRGRIAVWDTSKSGSELLKFNAYEDAKLPNGDWIATPTSSQDIDSIAYAGDGKSFVSITSDGNVRRWDADNGKLLKTLSLGAAQQIRAAALTQDGKFAVSAHENAKIHVWDTETNACVKSFQLSKGVNVRAVAFSKDGRRIVATAENEAVNVRRVSNLFFAKTELVNKTIVFDIPSGDRVL